MTSEEGIQKIEISITNIEDLRSVCCTRDGGNVRAAYFLKRLLKYEKNSGLHYSTPDKNQIHSKGSTKEKLCELRSRNN